MGYKEKLAFKISNGLLLLSYFTVRIVVAPIFVYETIIQTMNADDRTAVWAKVIYCGNVIILACLSQFWFWKLSYKTFVVKDPKKSKTA